MKNRDQGIPRIENVPLTDQARSAILTAIIEKRFEERLPSEDALAELLNVSRTTIRTALQSLEQDGIITRKRAIGTTVNAHVRASTLALQRMVGFDGCAGVQFGNRFVIASKISKQARAVVADHDALGRI